MLEGITSKTAEILIYTREPRAEDYPTNLACSAHFAIRRPGGSFEALNQNYGILFATSTIGDDNTIHLKALRSPWLFQTADGGFAVAAVRVNGDGSPDEESRGKVLLWTSDDLQTFHEIGLMDLGCDVHVAEVACAYNTSKKEYLATWRGTDGNVYQNTLTGLSGNVSISPARNANCMPGTAEAASPEGAINGNILPVSNSFCDRLAAKWMPLRNVAVQVPGALETRSISELNAVQATAFYSDGSTAQKPVLWEAGEIDFQKPGSYKAYGTLVQDVYPFPLAKGYADPDVLAWGGKYYFIATNDNTDAVGFYVREADTPVGLFTPDVKEHLILGKGIFTRCFWAPEFHVIGGSLYILCALAGEGWGPQSHMMRLKPGGSITDPGSWEAPVRVMKQDRAYLASEGITLDMTYFKAGGASYLVWSYREHIFTPQDTGSMLYIATINESEPWQLTCEPMLLSRPLYGWENVQGTINNEGPYAIVTGEKVFLAISGGAAGGYTYAVGLLTATIGSDLLNPASWAKSPAPLMSHYSVEGEYGPGHNAFFRDEHGNLMISYHAQEALTGTPRCTAIRRVHFNICGEPVFNLSPERDLDPSLTKVSTTVTVH